MLAKVIPTRIHGLLDYLLGILFLAIPSLLGWAGIAANLFPILGGVLMLYSLATRYELGIFRILPMRVHLVMDIVVGLLLMGLPLSFEIEGNYAIAWFVLLGLILVVAGLRTTTEFSAVCMVNKVQIDTNLLD